MKRFVKSTFGFMAVFALGLAVMWLVRSVPDQQPVIQVAEATATLSSTPALTPTSTLPASTPLATATPPPNITSTVTLTSTPAVTLTSTPTVTLSSTPALTPTSTVPASTPLATATPAPNITPTSTITPLPQPTAVPDQKIASLDFDTLSVTAVEPVESGPPYPALSWSPDGRQATFGREISCHILWANEDKDTHSPLHPYDLWLYDRETGQEQKLAEAAVRRAWAPDGSAIVYEAPAPDSKPPGASCGAGIAGVLYIIDLTTGQTHQLTTLELVLGASINLAWLPNNEIVYMDQARLWAIKPDGTGKRQLNDWYITTPSAAETGQPEYEYDAGDVSGYIISPDGKRVAYEVVQPNPAYPSNAELWISDLDGSNTTKIGARSVFFAWSPNSQTLLYAVDMGDEHLNYDPWVIKADGSGQKQLLDTYEKGFLRHTIWAPDSRWVAFTLRIPSQEIKEKIWVANTETGMTHILYTDESFTSSIRMLSWWPDGKMLLYALAGSSAQESLSQKSYLILGGNSE